MMQVFDSTPCALGEGALWHPLREQLFWFDILGKALYSRQKNTLRCWSFDEYVSATGWIDRDTLLIASESSLFRFDIITGNRNIIHPLESDNPSTRSNDGRADPWGGFWVGTMGKKAELGAGSIYRYYHGELQQLFDDITIPNAICFAPDRSCAYYADTAQRIIWRQPLEIVHGWPKGERKVFVDLRNEELNPDGAVCDAYGNLWNAQWGASRVAQYSPSGDFITAIAAPTQQVSCPALGGVDFSTLFVTTALQGASKHHQAHQFAGKTLIIESEIKGLPEYKVILD